MYIVPAFIKVNKNETGNLHLISNLDSTEIALDEEKYINEFLEIYSNGKEKIDTELASFLHKYNMLIEENSLADTIKTVIDDVTSKFFKVTIMPTEQCNFRCTYCYEQFKYGMIESCVVEHIMEFIKCNLNSGKYTEFMLDWFGGEPTLRVPNKT